MDTEQQIQAYAGHRWKLLDDKDLGHGWNSASWDVRSRMDLGTPVPTDESSFPMSIFDFVFPQQAQAGHLGDIARTSAKLASSLQSKEANETTNVVKITVLQRRIGKLENDVAMLSMVNALLIKKYIADTGSSPEQLRAALAEIDRLDGVQDGGFDTSDMRTMLGLPVQDASATSAKKERCADCGRKVLTQTGICLFCGGVVH
jgi:hypothetical protein